MNNISQLEVIARLLLSCVMASLIGLERESHGRPAGLRTHILVSLGSCLVMIISIYGFSGIEHDPARLAAQVVSGIGFLGAGTILREGISIKGLTTAASLWVVAGIGLAMGSGFYLPGIIGTLLAVLTLLLLEPIEKRLFTIKTLHLEVILQGDFSQVRELTSSISLPNFEIKHLELDFNEEKKEVILDMIIAAKNLTKDQIVEQFVKANGVKRITWK